MMKKIMLTSTSWSSLTVAIIAIISTFFATTAMKMDDMLMGQSLDSFLSGLVQHEQLSVEHKLQILSMSSHDDFETSDGGSFKAHYRDQGFATDAAKADLRDYLYAAVSEGSMEEETAERIASTLNLGGLLYTQDMEDSLAMIQGLNGPAPANYVGEGNMQRLGRWNDLPTEELWFYNGIWGYANEHREYALMCHGAGLNIVDVTSPSSPLRVQFVAMEGGGIWRDVCTHKDEETGATYAYVASQGKHGGGKSPNLFVFDLSYLSDDADKPNGEDSDPIPLGVGYMDLGETGFGHTINCDRGLLFLHTASSSDGCRVYDLTPDPMKPTFLFDSGGTGDCHDSMVQTDVDIGGGELADLWIISDGSTRKDTIRNIRNVDLTTKSLPPVISKTPSPGSIFAHSSSIYKKRYLFQTDENNKVDISIYDIGDVTNPQLISRFRYSEHDSAGNAIVHNAFVKGDYYYAAYYEGGYRVFDISNPYFPLEVGKVETHRDPNGKNINGDGKYENKITGWYEGAWNTYVDLPSGNLLVNDMYHGMFVVKANSPYSKPQAPIVSAVRDNNGDVKLSWNSAGSEVRGYAVERSFDSLTYTRLAEHLVSTTFLDSPDARGKSASYRVVAVNGEGGATSNRIFMPGTGTREASPPPTKAPSPPSPTNQPTPRPTPNPTRNPTPQPSPSPTKNPTASPTNQPTPAPSMAPTTKQPSIVSETKTVTVKDKGDKATKALAFVLEADAAETVVIERFEVPPKDEEKLGNCEVYTKLGSNLATLRDESANAAQWTQVYDDEPSVVSGLMVMDLSSPITILPNQMMTVQIACNKGEMYSVSYGEVNAGAFIAHSGISLKKAFQEEKGVGEYVGAIVYHTGLAKVTDGHRITEEGGETEDESATTYINSDQTKKGQPKRKVHLRKGGSRRD
ncbi:hypothetical protein ACHAWC_009915 [Mediolabrus comicus]